MDVSPKGSGDVLVNGEETDADPRYPWKPLNCDTTGEISLVAVAGNGYVFDHWSSVDSLGNPDGLDGRTQNPTTTEIFKSMFVTAHFIANTPDADAGADTEADEGDTVTLDGTGSTEPFNRPLTYEWTQISPDTPQIRFSGADTAAPSFIAPDVNDGRTCFAIQLTVTDPEGQTDTDTVNVCVSSVNEPPVAILDSGALMVDAGEEVNIVGSESYDPDGEIAAYGWDIVSGSQAICDALQGSIREATEDTLTFTAPDIDGSVVIALRVTDDDGRQSDPATIALTIAGSGGIENKAPVADAGADQSVDEGDSVYLDGTGSIDPDGTIVVYKWELSDGIGVDLTNADRPQAEFTAPQVDADMELTFRLTVTDDKGASSFDTSAVHVSDTADGNKNGMLDEFESNEGDVDADGIFDFDDPDSVCFRHINGEDEYISFYTSKGDLRNIRNLPETDAEIPLAGKPDGNCPFGVISYQIVELGAGETVTVTFVLPETLPEGLEFYKITETGWQKLPFSEGSRANEIRVTMKDGDPQTDEDGIVNGVIEDPSAFVVTDSTGGSESFDDVSSSGGGCFIKSLFRYRENSVK